MKAMTTLGMLAVCSVVACSGSSSGVEGGDAGSGDAASADAGADASNASDAASDGEAGVDDRIDPIAVGHAWTYDVTELGSYPLCPSGSHRATVLGQSMKDGRNAFEVTSLCANAGSFFYTVAGDTVDIDVQGLWVIALDSPVQEGHTWTNTVETYVWHDVGTQTVPAGTFPRCWKAQDTQGESFTIFCRGVGPVKWHVKDTSGNGYDAVLTAKSF